MADLGLLTPGIGADDPDDVALLRALLRTEVAWAHALERVGAAGPGAGAAVDAAASALAGDTERAVALAESLAADAVLTGNPVLGVVSALRGAVAADHRATVHQGLTSQDVMDTALMVLLVDAATTTSAALASTGGDLTALARRHRDTAVLGRTLGQAALPTTLGARAAGWLQAVAEAHTRLDRERANAPLSFGGATGTLAGAPTASDAPGDLFAAVTEWAQQLSLRVTPGPWHVTRFPVQRMASAFAEVCAAAGKIAADVLAATRPEVGELREHTEAGKGASSAMPFKSNPVLSITMRRCAMTAPHHLAQVVAAAGVAGDERPDGAWHAEWSALRGLARDAIITSRSAATLIAGLDVNVEAAARNLAAHTHGDHGVGHAPHLVDRILETYGYGA